MIFLHNTVIPLDLRNYSDPEYGMNIRNRGEGERSFFHDLRIKTVQYRARAELNQDELGQLIGAGQGTVSKFEKGKHLLREDALDRLIALLSSEEVITANMLRTLADTIESPLAKEVKERALDQFIERMQSARQREATDFNDGDG